MARAKFQVHLVTHHDGMHTGRLLSAAGFVEDPPSGYGRSEDEVFAQIQLALEEKPQLVSQFQWHDKLATRAVKVAVHPQAVVKRRHVIAKEAIELRMTYAWSEQEAGGAKVVVPRFGWWFVLEDIAMAPMVIRQTVSSAMLGKRPLSLYALRNLTDERIALWAPPLSKHERARSGSVFEDEATPTLHAVAEDWTALERGCRRRPIVGELDLGAVMPVVESPRGRSLLVVGSPGCGKTTWVRALARRLGKPGDDTARRVWAASADRIVAGMSYLGQWEQRCLDLVAELSGRGDFLYVDQLPQICAPQTGRTSIADMFLPAMAAGSVRLIAECTPGELERLASEYPTLLGRFHQVRLEPPASSAMTAFLAQYQNRIDSRRTIEPEGLRRLVQHLEFFQRDTGFPGKGVRFLDWFKQDAGPAADGSEPETIDASAISVAFARSTGLPLELISDLHVAGRDVVAQRLRAGVIGQDDACETAARVLTRFKAGLADPGRPIGSLFFVGPTGVGKTELAKQLARYMFSDAQRMVRLDMSEFMLPGSSQRMLAVGRGVRSLVEQVRQRPLSLILLDEIEKAHPEVFDLLLAMLGEGRMTDLTGRLVDFRMTLVVMTSNLGVREHGVPGFGSDGQTEGDLLGAVRQHFRPEFFNRIDHVVAFRGLTQDDIENIVDLEIEKVGRRSGLARRGLTLRVDPEARRWLAQQGWHPTRGARPLKRVIEELVMSPLGVRLSQSRDLRDVQIRVRVRQGRVVVE